VTEHHGGEPGMEAGGGFDEPLPPLALLPGLLLVLTLDTLTLLGKANSQGWLNALTPWLYACVPLFVLVTWKRSWRVYGCVRERALLDLGWGMLWGAGWRALSLLVNAALLWGRLLSLHGGDFLSIIVLIPFLEEFFFRGYLSRGLCAVIGRWPGIFLQALLFTLLPAHWTQGLPHVVGIFIFGVLAGWLVERRGAIWSAFGAHSFANALPTLILLVSPYLSS